MIRNLDRLRIVTLAVLAWATLVVEARGQEIKIVSPEPEDRLSVIVQAGNKHFRDQTPIRFEIREDRLGPLVRKALDQGPVALALRSAVAGPGDDPAEPEATFSKAQVERSPAGPTVVVTFILPDRILRKGQKRYWLETKTPDVGSSWTLTETKSGALDLKRDDKLVFRYNASPVSSPNYGPIQNRDAYIHPAYSPSGALITGDFSSSHPHHRGFFLAYERTKTGELTPDFWNIHYGTGKIYSEGYDKPVVGPVTAKFSTRHRWDAKDKATGKDVTVLRERWDIEVYQISDDYRVFDVTSTQQAVGRPLELLPYRYGGMAYRGPEPFVKGTLDVLTSEGLHRRDGDQKPAHWVDLTGPIADGSDKYAGAMIADHPSNPNYPNVARIHPTSLPFFCYVPSHDKPVTIAVDTPTVFRYRVLIHDGHPDRDLDDRIWRDFAEPPVVTVE